MPCRRSNTLIQGPLKRPPKKVTILLFLGCSIRETLEITGSGHIRYLRNWTILELYAEMSWNGPFWMDSYGSKYPYYAHRVVDQQPQRPHRPQNGVIMALLWGTQDTPPNIALQLDGCRYAISGLSSSWAALDHPPRKWSNSSK